MQWDVQPLSPLSDPEALGEMVSALASMRAMITDIVNDFVHPKSHIPQKRTKDAVVFVAVDATETHWAMWPMVEGREVDGLCEGDVFREAKK